MRLYMSAFTFAFICQRLKGSSALIHSKSSTSVAIALDMVRNRGLEKIEEGAKPLPGGMTLYVKPAANGKSIGDCPFAHFVRIVLAEKQLDYDLIPCTQEAKPKWLLDDYEGKLPALRHRKECYVESEVIAQYLDFFFEEPELSLTEGMNDAIAAIKDFFPAMAKFIKHNPNGDDEDKEKQGVLEEKLSVLQAHLSTEGRTGPYLVGNGSRFTLLDASMAPKLYAMDVCLKKIKGSPIDLVNKYPAVREYCDDLFERPSFKSTVEYGPETVVWGWSAHSDP